MKKTIISLMLLALSMTFGVAFSQEEVSLKPIPAGYMPEKGDIAIGISANPFLKYIGNAFNGATDNSLSSFGGQAVGGGLLETGAAAFDEMSGDKLGSIITKPFVSVMGKYMLEDNMAVTANFGIIGVNFNMPEYVQDDKAVALDPLSEAQVVDNLKTTISGGSFALGAEWSRRYRKIQGVGGVSLMYAFAKAKTSFTYGNEITDINQTPSTMTGYSSEGFLPNARPVGSSDLGIVPFEVGSVNGIGGILHAGVEWFFAPKVSIGGQVTLSAIYAKQSQVIATYEGFSPVSNKVETYTELVSPGMSLFLFGTENLGGNLFINFYF